MFQKIKLTTRVKKMLADTVTPVSIFLQLRDQFANTLLLESSDYHGQDNSFSYICCDPIATFKLAKKTLSIQYPDHSIFEKQLTDNDSIISELDHFRKCFQAETLPHKFITGGLFGYQAYDAVQHFETIKFEDNESLIPDMIYQAFRYVIAINHFNNELYIIEHSPDNQESGIDNMVNTIRSNTSFAFRFEVDGEEQSNFKDAEFLDILQKGKNHCKRGDVFQIVLSRRFTQGFKGDEFNVYRSLRSINPSPYLFFFDYGNFKLFGSSPEAQLVLQANKAEIHPIAGTFKRTGDDIADAELAKQLVEDPKENAEHVMLVDLARNDLSRHGINVKIETFREVQYYSHLIHLVSKVTADVPDSDSLQIIADTFPAGTLSGAPKYKAMQLIDQYEKGRRGFYGGCLGYLGFDGTFNHAIIIRSFLSTKNQLHYQAGAGVVFKSDIHSELEEVNNKLRALRKALEMAQTL